MGDSKFVPEAKKEFTIIREYYVSNDTLQGIYFLIYDELNNKLDTWFLNKDDITNELIWKKTSRFKKDLQAIIVEKGKGKENKMVIESGNVVVWKKGSTAAAGKKVPAQRIVFYLAPSIYKPF